MSRARVRKLVKNKVTDLESEEAKLPAHADEGIAVYALGRSRGYVSA